MELVAFVGKNLGSFDAEHPYSQSSTVVMVDDADMVEKILQVSDELNLGLRTDDVTHLGRSAVFPFSFPPALCDEDRVLQQTLMETGDAFATSSAAQVFATATLAQHGIDSKALLDVGERDFEQMLHFDDTEDEVLTRARSLVASAMKELRRVEALAQWISEDLLCRDLLDHVWRELKLKAEWSEISDRWSQHFAPPPRKSKNKKTRQKEPWLRRVSIAQPRHTPRNLGFSSTESFTIQGEGGRCGSCRSGEAADALAGGGSGHGQEGRPSWK